MGQKCPIPALVMAKGTKGLSAQYKKEMSRINRLTYGARKRGYEFNIPYHETRYGVSKLKEITSVKQLYKYSTKLVSKPYTGKIERVSGDIAREYERSKSAKQGAVTRELRKAFAERPYEGDSFMRLVRERARREVELPESHIFFGAKTKTAREIVREAIATQDWIDTVESTNYTEPEPDFQWHRTDDTNEIPPIEPEPEEPIEPEDETNFDDEEPPDYNKDEDEEIGDSEDRSWQDIEDFIDETRFLNKNNAELVSAIVYYALDFYDGDINEVASRLEKAFANGVLTSIYLDSRTLTYGSGDIQQLISYLGIVFTASLDDGYDEDSHSEISRTDREIYDTFG